MTRDPMPADTVTDTPAIYVDADACPVKEEVYKVAFRHGVKVFIVANSGMLVPRTELVERVLVPDGPDAADDWIAERCGPSSIVVTADIPLADRALKAGAVALSPTGKPFTSQSIGLAMATRTLMQDLRSGAVGDNIGGPPPFAKSDRSRFLQALDSALVKLLRDTR